MTTRALAERHQLHGVQPVLPVPDVSAAAAWYCRVLGFEIDFLHGDDAVEYGRVKLGTRRRWGDAVYIHLRSHSGPIAACGEIRLHVGQDIEGLHRHVLGCGANVLQAPTDQPWGLREMLLQAPGGHVLVLGAERAAPAQTAPPAEAV